MAIGYDTYEDLKNELYLKIRHQEIRLQTFKDIAKTLANTNNPAIEFNKLMRSCENKLWQLEEEREEKLKWGPRGKITRSFK